MLIKSCAINAEARPGQAVEMLQRPGQAAEMLQRPGQAVEMLENAVGLTFRHQVMPYTVRTIMLFQQVVLHDVGVHRTG